MYARSVSGKAGASLLWNHGISTTHFFPGLSSAKNIHPDHYLLVRLGVLKFYFINQLGVYESASQWN